MEAQSSPEAAPEARKPLTLEDVMASEDLIKQVAQQIIKQGGAKGIEFEHPKQGRPRKELIKGIDEVSVNLQLPETLVKALRKKAKEEKRTIKDSDECVSRAGLNDYDYGNNKENKDYNRRQPQGWGRENHDSGKPRCRPR